MKIFSTLFRRTTLSLFLIASVLSTITTSAQPPSHFPFSNSRETFSQMWNVGGTTWYYGTIPITAGSLVPVNAAPYGSQKDTGAAGGNIALTTSIITQGKVNADTVIATALPGYGGVTITAAVLKVSGTATVTATLASSTDGFVFTKVPGATVYTILPTSLTVFSNSTVVKWAVLAPLDRFYQVQFGGDGTNPYEAQAWCDFQRIFHLTQ